MGLDMEDKDMVKILMDLRDSIDNKFDQFNCRLEAFSDKLDSLQKVVNERDQTCVANQRECYNRLCNMFVKDVDLKRRVDEIVEEFAELKAKRLSRWKSIAENIIWFIRIFVLMLISIGAIKYFEILK